ncbi:MAG: hypothetical protein BWY78_01475 [Alphaproteobacteria bacterium ADurb.Bin438]|nr:MAG: hypothetical protein BWY78_01475 [Alphaproteobacteria bacterium ADurb.Bin438]
MMIRESAYQHKYIENNINYDFEDMNFVYGISLFKNYISNPNTFLNKVLFTIRNKLFKEVIKEINPDDKILQIGLSYGSQIPKMSKMLSNNGYIDIAGIAPDVLKRIKPLISPCSNVYVTFKDADKPPLNKYDKIVCFFMLYKSDDKQKSKIINALLQRLDVGGKLIFVDYHNPSKFNLFKFFMYIKNKLWHENALSLWKNQIVSFANFDEKSQFIWEKETYFGSLYQKVTVTKKN